MGVSFAVSPDGRRIVFTGGSGGASSLWVWSAEDGQARRLEDSGGGVSPFFSPDGREVAFFAGNDLKRAPIEGGPATTIAAVPLASAGTWSRDGTILLTRPVGADAGLYRVPARGGELQPVVSTPSLREQRAFPRFLPDGRSYLFLSGFGRPVADRRLCVASLDDAEPDCFTTCHSQADYSASGHVLCVRAGTLVALPFDARTRKATGDAVTVARDVRWFGPSGSASFAVSADGRALAYEPRPAVSRLAWLDRAGRETGAIGEPGTLGLLQISPDGRRIAADVWHPDGHGRDLWALETASGVASRLTFSPIDAWALAWAPDGKSLAYANAEEGPPDVTVLHLDGSGRQEVLLRAPVCRPRDTGLPTGVSSSTRTPRWAGGTSGSSGSCPSTGRTAGSPRRLSAATTAASRRTGEGSPTCRRSRGGRRSTSRRWRVDRPDASRGRGGCCHAGAATGPSSSSFSPTAW
jgi:serine/threonine-protein kinase